MQICLDDYSEDERIRYNRIKTMSKEDLSSIKPIWASANNKEKLISSSIYFGLESSSMIIVNVVLQRLIDLSEFWELDPNYLITDHTNDFRFVKIIERWESGKPIDPPEIYFKENSDSINFSDGRHRTIAAFHIGVHSIPVVISKYELEKLKPIICD